MPPARWSSRNEGGPGTLVTRRAGPAGAPVDLPVPVRPAALDRVRAQELVGAAAGHRGAVPVADAVLPGAVPDRAQDLLRGVLAARPAALRARVPLAGRGRPADEAAGRQLRLSSERAPVRQLLDLFDQGRILFDPV